MCVGFPVDISYITSHYVVGKNVSKMYSTLGNS